VLGAGIRDLAGRGGREAEGAMGGGIRREQKILTKKERKRRKN